MSDAVECNCECCQFYRPKLTEANRRGEELIKYGNNLMQNMVGGGKQARAEELFFEALVEATATSKRGGE
jgi:hypothetical protein